MKAKLVGIFCYVMCACVRVCVWAFVCVCWCVFKCVLEFFVLMFRDFSRPVWFITSLVGAL